MWGRKGKRFPDMPRGVRIEKVDGSVVPLELTYEGRRHGVNFWQTVLMAEFNVGDQFAFDYMPSRTEIAFTFRTLVWEADEDDRQ